MFNGVSPPRYFARLRAAAASSTLARAYTSTASKAAAPLVVAKDGRWKEALLLVDAIL